MEAERQEVEDVVEAEKREVEDVMEEERQEVEDEVEGVVQHDTEEEAADARFFTRAGGGIGNLGEK